MIKTKIAASALVLGAVTALTPVGGAISHGVFHGVQLAADELAFVMGPTGIATPNQAEIDAATQLYLNPNGFDGTAVALTTPEQYSNQSYLTGENDLVNAVEAAYANGQFGSDDPLYIFGYSQSAAIAGAVEPQLHADGIPTEDLHFVLVGDSASAYGGFFNTYPDLTNLGGFPNESGLTTPGQYYPTDVYTIAGDNWADAPNATLFGIPSLSSIQHEEYLGLTPDEVASAMLSHTDGMTDYYTISDDSINQLSALLESFLLTLGVIPTY